MIAMTKKVHSDGMAEISLCVPNKDMQRIFEATRQFLQLVGYHVQEVNEAGEALHTLEEVFPDTHPGLALKGRRVREGLTQKALAAQIGISASNLSDMEHGRRPIGKEMARRIGAALGEDYRVFL